MKKADCNTESHYIQQRQNLLSFINSRVQNIDHSEDILQDTFVQFETCCQRGCTCDHPKSYLFKMALNAISDFFKKEKKEKKINEQLAFLQSIKTEAYTELPCDVYKCTHQFLSTLSEENRSAFIKSDIEKIPQNQIAAELNIPISTLKSRVQRTRQFLKQKFISCLEED